MSNIDQQIQHELVSFQIFRSIEQAEELSEILKKAGIICEVKQLKQFFDPSFAFNKTDPDISLNLQQEDFSRARDAMQAYYQTQLDQVDKDYYLFQFSDNELSEIIRKPYEWGSLDYELAKRILHNHGIEISHEVESAIKTQRIRELSKPEADSTFWVFAGYIAALLGGFFGIIIGWLLAYLTKTLPNGDSVFVYNDADRKHGKIIFAFSVVSFISFMIYRLVRQYQ